MFTYHLGPEHPPNVVEEQAGEQDDPSPEGVDLEHRHGVVSK